MLTRRNEGQREGGGQHREDILRAPGEAGERRQPVAAASRLPFRASRERARRHTARTTPISGAGTRGDHSRGERRRHNHRRDRAQGHDARVAGALHQRRELPERGTAPTGEPGVARPGSCPAARSASCRRCRRKIPTPRHAERADMAAQAHDAEAHHDHGGHDGDFGRAADPLVAHGAAR